MCLSLNCRWATTESRKNHYSFLVLTAFYFLDLKTVHPELTRPNTQL